MTTECKKIRFPKTEKEFTNVLFNRTGIFISKNGAYRIKLKSQIIEGTKIPAMEIWVGPHQIVAELDCAYAKVLIRKDRINEILRTVTMDNLRSAK